MTPLDVYHWIFSYFLPVVLDIMGFTLLEPILIFNCRNRFLVFFLVFSCGCFAYTFAAYDSEVALQASSFVTLPIQGLVKFHSFLRYIFGYYAIVRYLRLYYESINDASSASYNLVLRFAKQFALVVKLFSALLFVMGIVVALSPFLLYALFGTWEPLALVYMPFVDENTFIGFWALYVYHLMTVALCVIGFISADLLLGLFTLHYVPMVLVFEQHVVQFNEVITKNLRLAETREAHEFFGNIIVMHKELMSYMQVVCSINIYVFFVELNADTLSLIVCLYILSTTTFYPAYLLFLLMFVKLMALCVLGTIVDIMNDKLLDVLTNLNWYLLPIPVQKDYCLMLVRAQTPSILYAGTVPINLDTFVNSMKSVYSVGMLLAESVQ